MDKNFKDEPVSLTEIKSEREEDGSPWTVRDVLISILRDLDKGEIKPERIVVIWNEGKHVHVGQCSDNVSSTLGNMEVAKTFLLA